MGGTYSRVVEATVTGGAANCIELPMPPRGILERLIVKQTAGANVDFDYVVYNRKGACATGIDLHVNGGAVTTVVTDGGNCKLTITTTQAYPYGYALAVGDTLYVKGTNVAAYNVVHTVTAVNSATEIVTDVTYSSAITTDGVWQDSVPAVYRRNDPTMNIVNANTTGTSGNASAAFDMERTYENADNQDETSRRRATALWVDLSPEGSSSKTFEIAYTADVQYDF